MNKNGFTIVELMLFLAIAGALFIFGISNLLKTQNEDQFRVGLGLLKTQIQTYINNTAEGNYSLPNNYYCLPGPNRLYISNIASGSTTSPDCMYLGSVLSFTNNNYNQSWTLNVLPVFGYTFKNNTINQLQPNSVNLAQAEPITSAILNRTYNVPSGLSVYSVYYLASSTRKPINSFLLYNKFNQYISTQSSLLNSSSQYINIAPLEPYYSGNLSIPSLTRNVNQLTDSCQTIQQSICMINPTSNSIIPDSIAPINPGSGVRICLNDSSLGISADLIIGSQTNSSYKALTTILYNKKNCI